MANACIYCIVINKLRYLQKLYSVILFKIDNSLELNFYYIILSFGLTIRLKMKGDKKLLLDLEEIVKQ